MLEETKPKTPTNPWEVAIIIGVALVTSAVIGGGIWYYMDQNEKAQAKSYSDTVTAMQKQIDELKNMSAPVTPVDSSTGTTDTATGAGVLNEAKLANGYYIINGKSFTMVNGVYKTGIYEYTLESKYESYSKDKNTVAVIVKETSGGTGVFRHLVIMGNLKGAATHIADIDLGDRVQVSSVSLSESTGSGNSRTVTVAMTDFAPNDPSCCPSLNVTKLYNLSSDSKLTLQ